MTDFKLYIGGRALAGAKASGLGRELGLEGLHEFSQAHTISMAR